MKSFIFMIILKFSMITLITLNSSTIYAANCNLNGASIYLKFPGIIPINYSTKTCVDVDDDFFVGVTTSKIGNSLWLVTDQSGIIKDFQYNNHFNFNGFSEVIPLLIYHVAFTESLSGLTIGENAANLSGCFDFSDNYILVELFDNCTTQICTNVSLANLPSGEGDYSNRWVKQSFTIENRRIIGQVVSRSSQSIEMKPSFEVESGASFMATINDCLVIPCKSQSEEVIIEDNYQVEIGAQNPFSNSVDVSIYDIVSIRCGSQKHASFSPTPFETTRSFTCQPGLEKIDIYIFNGAIPVAIETFETSISKCSASGICNTGPLFECKFIVKDIQDANPPSITFDIYEIVCINTLPNCNAPLNYISASFSMDPIDTKKTFHCSDIGDIQLTIFVWDVEDSNNDGTLEYIFREPCFAIQTVEDPSGFCTF